MTCAKKLQANNLRPKCFGSQTVKVLFPEWNLNLEYVVFALVAVVKFTFTLVTCIRIIIHLLDFCGPWNNIYVRVVMLIKQISEILLSWWCREQSGILLRGPDRKKPDRLAANQSARFARIPDRKKINSSYSSFTVRSKHPKLGRCCFNNLWKCLPIKCGRTVSFPSEQGPHMTLD